MNGMEWKERRCCTGLRQTKYRTLTIKRAHKTNKVRQPTTRDKGREMQSFDARAQELKDSSAVLKEIVRREGEGEVVGTDTFSRRFALIRVELLKGNNDRCLSFHSFFLQKGGKETRTEFYYLQPAFS